MLLARHVKKGTLGLASLALLVTSVWFIAITEKRHRNVEACLRDDGVAFSGWNFSAWDYHVVCLKPQSVLWAK
jgi:hypothetical protein